MSFFRIFFTADIHNSEAVFRRILSVPQLFNPNLIIISGDLTGKAIVPIIEEENKYTASYGGEKFEATDKRGLEEIKSKLLSKGVYPYVCTKKEVEELKNKPEKIDLLFKELIILRIKEWVKIIEEKIPKDISVIMMPGNDDIFEVDDVISSSSKVIYPLKKSIEIANNYEILSFDYVNKTPWDTPREAEEDELWEMLEDIATKAKNMNRVICNFHCPPYRTNLDLAPKLDKKLKPVYKFGELQTEHVGSKAIRKFFEKYSPLVGLHGHIHESEGFDKIGKTMIFNPGTHYSAGVLKGLVLDLDQTGIAKWFKI